MKTEFLPKRPWPWIALAALVLFSIPSPASAVPTVNGLFYGDGDSAEYILWNTSYYGSGLYVYYDVPSVTLYVALVVDESVNDNVFGASDPAYAGNYMASAGWGAGKGQQRSAADLINSEYSSFSLACAFGSTREWEWQTGYACETGGVWVSDETCGTSAPILNGYPPSLTSASSFAWNVNTYEAKLPAGAPWDMYVFDPTEAIANWKSPFSSTTTPPNNTVVGLDHPTYTGTYEWEWAMVYEWSVDLAAAGCGNEPVYLVTGLSHHSPMKEGVAGQYDPECGEENDCFPPDGGDPDPLSDFGDLPDIYGTRSASGGPQHFIKATSPYLGAALDPELDGNPGAGASGDNTVGADDEDGVTANITENWTAGSTQSFDVVSSGTGLLGAWIDWNGDGDFADAGEFVIMNVVAGSNTLNVTVGSGFDWFTDDLYARFRLFSSGATAPGGSLDVADSTGTAEDGEVEDYRFDAISLPVTLNAFSSEFAAASTVTVRWQTATETDNVGFELLGRVDGEWLPLSAFIPSKGMNSDLPLDYEIEVFLPAGLTELELVDYSTRGRPERFGPFTPGGSYGEIQAAQKVDWTGPRERQKQRLEERGFKRPGAEGVTGSARWKKLHKAGSVGRGAERSRAAKRRSFESAAGDVIELNSSSTSTHVAVTSPGVQRVTYESLLAAGLDLTGQPARNIAVTWRGQPVARRIDGSGLFGPGSAIEFVGHPPQGEAALFIDANLYQVAVDRARAVPAGNAGLGRARNVSPAYLKQSMVERQVWYNQQSPTGDPWIETSVLVLASGRTVTLDLPVDGPVLPGPGRLSVGLGTITDLPDLTGTGGEVIPEHNVEVWFAGAGGNFEYVTSSSTSGQEDWKIEVDLPSGTVRPGVNQLQLRFHTDYFFSLVVIDQYGVSYPAPYLGPDLAFNSDPDADGYLIEGFSTPSVVAYAEHPDGSITHLAPRMTSSASGFTAQLRQVEGARIWVTEVPHTPAVFTTEAPADMLSQPADLVVIAGSSFVGTPALNDYLALRSDLSPVVVDVEDIYNSVGYGMALPGAITDYLELRDAVQPFSHVQLVGTDCYDRLNRISDCVSFLPLPYAQVGVTLYSPSQNRLVDFDGDGVGDKAVGQFSVRDESELATIVDKARDWIRSGLSATRSALLIAEETDGINDFAAQTERLGRNLGWSDAELLNLADHPDITTARSELHSSLSEGRALTVFSGHSSPVIWAFRGVLTADSAATLSNQGLPTLMVPLACESTYDISASADVLGHQLLYAGAQGALAITGAVALSGLEENELMAGFVLDGLDSGLTLGEAVQVGREALGTSYPSLQDNWLTQGDVAVRLRSSD